MRWDAVLWVQARRWTGTSPSERRQQVPWPENLPGQPRDQCEGQQHHGGNLDRAEQQRDSGKRCGQGDQHDVRAAQSPQTEE